MLTRVIATIAYLASAILLAYALAVALAPLT
jgi:hypothetical protein